MKPQVHSFVLSGGIGSRLWPFSRADNPKQFHRLTGAHSMLRNTIRRFSESDGLFGPVNVIASADHAQIVRQETVVEGVLAEQCLFEPTGRNTAAAVALAAQEILEKHGDGLVLIVPSDHEITTINQFHDTISSGVASAHAGALVVFGITPTRPETGYGYVKTGDHDATGTLRVERFVEKPDTQTAERYLQSGGYFWNAGMILFQASTMAGHFKALAPEIWQGVEASRAAASTELAGSFLPMEEYSKIPSHPVDTVILENAENITLVPAQFKWSDIGSWQSLYEIAEKDERNNVSIGDVVAVDCEGSYFHNEGPLISAYGLKGMAVISTDDATFVAPLEHSQDVKNVFQKLDQGNRSEVRVSVGLSRAKNPGTNVERVHRWLTEIGLPLWAKIGVDHVHGGFHEVLGFDEKSLNKPKRLRTMARQTWCFAQAAKHNWCEGADALVHHGLDWLDAAANAEVPFASVASVDGKPENTRMDAYDQSFVLLAAAAALDAGFERARPLGELVLQTFSEKFFDADNNAWFETSEGASLERRANPHMHLLEAFLAWQEVTGSKEAQTYADGIVELFRTKFFDRDNWAVIEVLGPNFEPLASDKGELTEPGHHFEWAWLLGEHARQRGQAHADEARKVYATGVSQGLSRKTNLGWASITRDGVPIDRHHRSWPQAEALKAAIILDRTGKQELAGEIEARVDRLFAWHLDNAPEGLWVDRIDEHGVATATDVPASILYHIVGAFQAYLNHFGDRSA